MTLKPIKLKPIAKIQASEIARNAAISEQKAKADIKNYIDQSPQIDITNFTEKWDAQSAVWSANLLDIIIKIMSVSDGVVKVNDTFKYALNMPNTSLSEQQFNSLLVKVFNIKIFHSMLESVDIPDEFLHKAMERMIARELPTKDNMPKESTKQNKIVPIPNSFTKKDQDYE